MTRGVSNSKLREGFSFLLILVVGFAYLFYVKHDVILFNQPLNPDEAQFTASAIAMSKEGRFNFDVSDNGSSGPLNSLPLAWPKLFGQEINIATTRVAEVVISFGTFILILMIVNVFARNVFLSTLLASPYYIYLLKVSGSDFIHYSSEKFPTFLVLAAFFFFFKFMVDKKVGRTTFVYLVAILAGCVPYTKLQFVFFAIFIGALTLITLYLKRDSYQSYLAVVLRFFLIGLIPTFYLIGGLLIENHFNYFYYDYLNWAINYVSQPLSITSFFSLLKADMVYMHTFSFGFGMSVFLLSLVFLFNLNKEIFNLQYPLRLAIGIFLATLLLAYYSIVKPGQAFPHYLNMILPYLVIIPGLLIVLVVNAAGVFKKLLLLLISMFYLCQSYRVFSIQSPKSHPVFLPKNNPVFLSDGIFEKNNLLSWLNSGQADSVTVWGWDFMYYVDSDLKSATPQGSPYNFLSGYEPVDVYKKMYISALIKKKPEYIIDAITPTSFTFNNPNKQSILRIPELSQFISDEYKKIPNVHGNTCPTTYIRKNKYLEVMGGSVSPISVVSSGDLTQEYNVFNLIDNSVSERCSDYWLLPHNKLGQVSFGFNAKQTMSKMKILNTHAGNGWASGTYASDEVEVKVFGVANKLLFRQVVKMKKYPIWTDLDFGSPLRVKKINIAIKSYYNYGGGLNEVKFLK